MLQILRPQTQMENINFSDSFGETKSHRFDLSSGFAHLPASYFISEDLRSDQSELAKIQNTFHKLPEDQFGGGRFRAHSKVLIDRMLGSVVVLPSKPYQQSRQYNNDLGDVQREYAPMPTDFLESPILSRMINKNLAMAIKAGHLSEKNLYTVGLHQIRYLATPLCPSVSSPIWLHKDDEDLVFVHLFNLTSNTIGGDSLISKDCRSISNVIRLETPMETVVLTKKVFHAVTPIGSLGGVAYRDILLVTMVNDES